jgi:hypothetical protein
MSTVQDAIKTLATASEYSLRHHVDEIDVVLSEVSRLQGQLTLTTEQLFSQEQIIETLEAREEHYKGLYTNALELLRLIRQSGVSLPKLGSQVDVILINAHRGFKCAVCKDTGIETCDGNHPCTACTGKVN